LLIAPGQPVRLFLARIGPTGRCAAKPPEHALSEWRQISVLHDRPRLETVAQRNAAEKSGQP
jgi:hypothetical protein